jgi:Phosphodiester glycosidase
MASIRPASPSKKVLPVKSIISPSAIHANTPVRAVRVDSSEGIALRALVKVMTRSNGMSNRRSNAAIRFSFVVALLAYISPVFAQSEAGNQNFQTVGEGVEHLRIVRSKKTDAVATGPWLINLLRIDLGKVDLRTVHALDAGVGLETTSSIANRYAAIAAVNGGYFRTTGTYRGESDGVFQLDGKLISEPREGRAAFGLIKRGGQTRVIFGHLKFSGSLKPNRGDEFVVSGINRPRAANEIIVYTPEFHRTTLTSPDGVEIIVRGDRAVAVVDRTGSSVIPSDGYVISAAGTARDWALKNLAAGSRVELKVTLIPVENGQADMWKQACCIVGGGPQLVRNGQVEITAGAEKIGDKFVTDLHPRTAIARLQSGRILLVTVDGRQPDVSVGMSLTELAALLLEFGAVEAINLDGGGSTAMVVNGKIVNNPSDATGERAVSDAIIVVPRSNGNRR